MVTCFYRKGLIANTSVKEGGVMDKKWTVICPPGQRWASSSVSDVAHSFTDGSQFHSLKMWSACKDNAPGDWLEWSIIRNRGTAVQLFLYKDKTMWRRSLVEHLTLEQHPQWFNAQPRSYTEQAVKHSHFNIKRHRVNGKLVSNHMRCRIWWKGEARGDEKAKSKSKAAQVGSFFFFMSELRRFQGKDLAAEFHIKAHF